jgi:hypothetical protein
MFARDLTLLRPMIRGTMKPAPRRLLPPVNSEAGVMFPFMYPFVIIVCAPGLVIFSGISFVDA